MTFTLPMTLFYAHVRFAPARASVESHHESTNYEIAQRRLHQSGTKLNLMYSGLHRFLHQYAITYNRHTPLDLFFFLLLLTCSLDYSNATTDHLPFVLFSGLMISHVQVSIIHRVLFSGLMISHLQVTITRLSFCFLVL